MRCGKHNKTINLNRNNLVDMSQNKRSELCAGNYMAKYQQLRIGGQQPFFSTIMWSETGVM